MTPFLSLRQLTKNYRVGKKTLTALHPLDLDLFQGQTLGLVGESGCGKSTVARTILGLQPPTSGQIYLQGKNLAELTSKKLFEVRRQMQIIFQDPSASLNPRMRVGEILSEPLDIHGLLKGAQRPSKLIELLELVGLSQDHLSRFPHELSGGQKQRIGIARALSLSPSLLICDEPISALDVSIQAQIVNLFKRLQKQMGLTYLFIAHDLSMIKHLCDRVAVMYLGHVVELAESETLYKNPAHPYTEALLSAIPIPDPVVEKKRHSIVLKGELPSPFDPPKGCPFKTRCPYVQPLCHTLKPELKPLSGTHQAACHFPLKFKP